MIYKNNTFTPPPAVITIGSRVYNGIVPPVAELAKAGYWPCIEAPKPAEGFHKPEWTLTELEPLPVEPLPQPAPEELEELGLPEDYVFEAPEVPPRYEWQQSWVEYTLEPERFEMSKRKLRASLKASGLGDALNLLFDASPEFKEAWLDAVTLENDDPELLEALEAFKQMVPELTDELIQATFQEARI